MTRKDYVLIAEAIKSVLDVVRTESDNPNLSDRGRAVLAGERIGIQGAALRLADTLRQDNPRFEWKRFMVACGFDMD